MVASYGGQNTFFEVPGMIVGYPLYNIHECAGYVIDNLRKAGFLVQVLPPPHVCVMYVSWDQEELKGAHHKKRKPLAIEGPKAGVKQGGDMPLLRFF